MDRNRFNAEVTPTLTVNAHKKRLLLAAQASLPQPHQLDAYRTLLLDDLGGFEKELADTLAPHTERLGTGRPKRDKAAFTGGMKCS